MTRKLSLLFRKGLFKIEKMYVKASTIEKPLEKGRKLVRNTNAKITRVAASVALSTSLVLPISALAEETKEEATENNETPIEMDAETNEVEVSTNTPIEVSADVEVIDETNTVTFTSETIAETEETALETLTETEETAQETKESATETEETKHLDVETIIPGKNVSENENETKVVMPADSTYVVFTTEDGKQVIWNAESLGNPNQDKFINSYNGIANDKIGESYVFNDGYGNIVYAGYAKDENGNLIINEDGTVQIVEQVIGTMTIDEATGEKVFVGNGNVNVNYGVNTPKEVLDPEADYDKPVEPTPVPEIVPTPVPELTPDPEPTPEPDPEPEPKPETGTLVKTGDNRAMVITGLGALALASGLLLPLTANTSRKNTKRLILK